MHDLNELAIQLHNKYQPKWDLSDSTELVWQLKLNCMDRENIHEWFEFVAQNEDNKDVGIIVESLPDELIKDDWR